MTKPMTIAETLSQAKVDTKLRAIQLTGGESALRQAEYELAKAQRRGQQPWQVRLEQPTHKEPSWQQS